MNPGQGEDQLVSVIIPVYNGSKVIGECLDAVFSADYENLEAIVVDDCSSDDSAGYVRKEYPRARVVSTKRNRGFAGAVNAGIRASGGSIIVLLNMDTVVDKGWLGPLVDALTADESIGLVGSKIFFEDGKTLQHAGGLLLENGLPVHRGRGEVDTGKYEQSADVDYLCGASLGFRRGLLEKTGFLDEGFRPLYYEDTDLACRVRNLGMRVVYIPGSVLVHKENVSTGCLTKRFYYYFHKSRLRFVFKNYSMKEIIRGFLPREKKWFSEELPRDIRATLRKAYLISIPGIIVLLIKRGFKKI